MEKQEILDLITNYNKLHIEVVQTLKRFLTLEETQAPVRRTLPSPPSTPQAPVRTAIPSSPSRMTLTLMQRTPLGRRVRQREEWTEEQTQMLLDIIETHPTLPLAAYRRKMGEHGFEKSIEQIRVKIKNHEAFLRREGRSSEERVELE